MVAATLLLALSLSAAGVALAAQSFQQRVAGESRVASDGEGVIDTALETHAHHQHGGIEGHLPPRQSNVKLVGKAAIDRPAEGRVADVGVFGDFAYLAAFSDPNCERGGVYAFSIANPSNPRQVNFIKAAPGSFVGEGVQVIKVTTPKFRGDLLIHNNEICDPRPTQRAASRSTTSRTRGARSPWRMASATSSPPA